MKQILLVDDKASIGKVLSMYLGKEYDFVYCEDPLKAIDWLHEGGKSSVSCPLKPSDSAPLC